MIFKRKTKKQLNLKPLINRIPTKSLKTIEPLPKNNDILRYAKYTTKKPNIFKRLFNYIVGKF